MPVSHAVACSAPTVCLQGVLEGHGYVVSVFESIKGRPTWAHARADIMACHVFIMVRMLPASHAACHDFIMVHTACCLLDILQVSHAVCCLLVVLPVSHAAC